MIAQHKTITVLEDNKNLTGGWFQNFRPQKTRLLNSETINRERREYFRLSLRSIRTLGVTIQNGSTFKTVINDLSAGGFSCTGTKSNSLHLEDQVSVSFDLPLERPISINTKASLVEEENFGSKIFRTKRFRFSNDISETERDIIHGYIMREQFDLMNVKLI